LHNPTTFIYTIDKEVDLIVFLYTKCAFCICSKIRSTYIL